ncbi:hypothetical protein [Rhodoplanes sp. SY1]|uniref:hypothetical protein n=1 Tax=Rhodoplanes sp. SY1 TaxID=3166646 RepID=UPI0038B65474
MSAVASLFDENKVPSKGATTTLVSNGHEVIAVPEAELRRVDALGIDPIGPRKVRDSEAADIDDFDWDENDSIVLQEQRATAVYRNKRGALVIRQERSWDEEDDTFIVISRTNEQAFIDRLCDELGIGSAGRRS